MHKHHINVLCIQGRKQLTGGRHFFPGVNERNGIKDAPDRHVECEGSLTIPIGTIQKRFIVLFGIVTDELPSFWILLLNDRHKAFLCFVVWPVSDVQEFSSVCCTKRILSEWHKFCYPLMSSAPRAIRSSTKLDCLILLPRRIGKLNLDLLTIWLEKTCSI